MKTANLPPLRVAPSLRSDLESVLEPGETISSFVEDSLKKHITARRVQQEFIARGLRARDEAKASGIYIDADTMLAELREMRLAKERADQAGQ